MKQGYSAHLTGYQKVTFEMPERSKFKEAKEEGKRALQAAVPCLAEPVFKFAKNDTTGKECRASDEEPLCKGTTLCYEQTTTLAATQDFAFLCLEPLLFAFASNVMALFIQGFPSRDSTPPPSSAPTTLAQVLQEQPDKLSKVKNLLANAPEAGSSVDNFVELSFASFQLRCGHIHARTLSQLEDRAARLVRCGALEIFSKALPWECSILQHYKLLLFNS